MVLEALSWDSQSLTFESAGFFTEERLCSVLLQVHDGGGTSFKAWCIVMSASKKNIRTKLG